MSWRILFVVAVAGCAASRIQIANQHLAGGRYREAAKAYQACVDHDGLLDCYVGLGELYRGGGPLADCGRLIAVATAVEERYGSAEAYLGDHAREHVSPSALGPDDRSLARWFGTPARRCQEATAERSETIVERRAMLLQHPCAVARGRSGEPLDPTTMDRLAAACDELRRQHDGGGGDEATRQVMAEAMVLGALTALDERFIAACEAPTLRPSCPPSAELRRRVSQRLLALVESPAPALQQRWAKHYLMRWPDGEHAPRMRLVRERAELDLALALPLGQRAEPLDEFLRSYPESPLRDEALEAIWEDARSREAPARYRAVAELYPDARFAGEARARAGKRR